MKSLFIVIAIVFSSLSFAASKVSEKDLEFKVVEANESYFKVKAESVSSSCESDLKEIYKTRLNKQAEMNVGVNEFLKIDNKNFISLWRSGENVVTRETYSCVGKNLSLIWEWHKQG